MPPPYLLVVDDAPEMGLFVRHLGQRAGQRVEHCLDGESAWELLTARTTAGAPCPDLILIDFHLPGLSGAEWCRRFRGLPGGVGLRIALLSSWTEAVELVEALEAGCDFILSKELLVRPDAWLARVSQLALSPRGGPGSLSACPHDAIPPSTPPAALQQVFREAGQHPAVCALGPEVYRALLRRAVASDESLSDPNWSSSEVAGLAFARVPPVLRPGVAARLASALVDQVWRVAGPEAATPFRDALEAALLRLSPPRNDAP